MMITRLQIRVEGIVQGVGFRPFVYALAARLGITGWVANDSHGVSIEAESEGDNVERFLAALEQEAPLLAVLTRVSSRSIPPQGETQFVITPSRRGREQHVFISPDVATCADCLQELLDSADRR